MRTLVGILVLCSWSTIAHAERTTTVNLGAMVGGVENPQQDAFPTLQGSGGPRVTLSWENPPIDYPTQKGWAVDVALVPEITAGAILNAQRGDAFLGVGARGELQAAQTKGGLLGISLRTAFYLGARAMVIGKNQDTGVEITMGEYIYLNKRLRIGAELNILIRADSDAPAYDYTRMGLFVSAYIGWAM